MKQPKKMLRFQTPYRSTVPPTSFGNWLQAPGSLTAHLKACCTHFSVKVRQQGKNIPWPEETRILHLNHRKAVFSREVLLYCDQQPVVFARSSVPFHALHFAWPELLELGNQPLGHLLFNKPIIQRHSRLKFIHFLPKHPQTHWVQTLWKQETGHLWKTNTVWARQSCYIQHDIPLLLIEYFEPSITQFYLK